MAELAEIAIEITNNLGALYISGRKSNMQLSYYKRQIA